MFCFLFLISTLFPNDVIGGRILFNQMHDSGSHIGSMMPIAQRLVQDGHYVHFLESNTRGASYNFPANINYTYISLKSDPILAGRLRPAMWRINIGPAEFPMVWKTGDNALVEIIEEHYEKFEAIRNDTFDVVVADELFAVSSYAVALDHHRRKGSAFILLNTCVSTNIMRWHMSLGSMFYWRPSIFHPVGQLFDMELFYARLHSTVHAIWNHVGVEIMTTYNAIRGFQLMSINDFHLSQLAEGSSYYFVDDLNSLVWPYPVGTDLIHIGYTCPIVDPLPADYLSFIQGPQSKGTIFIAFGSNVAWKDVTSNVMEAFVAVINRLNEYRVIFSFNGRAEDVGDLSSHCMITKWAPQKEILHDSRTKLFISHGGMKSLKDTICAEVPVVVMPLFAEQTHNSEMARYSGIAEVVDKLTVTADALERTIRKVLDNGKFKRATSRIKRFMLDRPVDSLKLASHSVKRARKYKNETKRRTPTFKRNGIFLSMRTYFYLDLMVAWMMLFLVCLI